jgi:hypothetical protein
MPYDSTPCGMVGWPPVVLLPPWITQAIRARKATHLSDSFCPENQACRCNCRLPLRPCKFLHSNKVFCDSPKIQNTNPKKVLVEVWVLYRIITIMPDKQIYSKSFYIVAEIWNAFFESPTSAFFICIFAAKFQYLSLNRFKIKRRLFEVKSWKCKSMIEFAFSYSVLRISHFKMVNFEIRGTMLKISNNNKTRGSPNP